MPLQISKSSDPFPRSRSPVVPGAWPNSNPPTPLHHKRKTCTAASLASPETHAVSSASPDPLHLDHVLNFHRRLSLSLSQSPDSDHALPSFVPFTTSQSNSTSLGPSNSGFIPSDDSDVTKFTRLDTSTSQSVFANTSVSTTFTSHSSPERSVTAKVSNSLKHSYDLKYPTMTQNKNDNLHEIRKYQYHDPNCNLNSDQLEDQDECSKPELVRANKLLSSPSPSIHLSRSQRSRVGLPSETSPLACRTSPATLPPSSPIVFGSPTSSHRALSIRRAQTAAHDYSSSYEYEGSPSWETSYRSDYNDEDMLRTGSRPISPSPSPSPLRHFNNNAARDRRGEGAELGLKEPETRSLSIDVDTPALPMLTSLSLPNSPDTSSHMSLNAIPIPAFHPGTSVHPSPIITHDAPEMVSVALASPPVSYPSNSPASLSASLSLTSSLRAELEVAGTGRGHIVTFPSHSPSASSFTTPASPRPTPASELDDIHTTGLGETSAADYVAAIMSSAWGSDDHAFISPESPVLTGVDNHDAAEMKELTPQAIDNEGLMRKVVDFGGIKDYPQPRGTQTGSFLAKAKRLGGRVRRFLTGKSKEGRKAVNADADVNRGGGNSRVVSDTGEEGGITDVAATEDPYVPEVDVVRPDPQPNSINSKDYVPTCLPSPPGLIPRGRKPRPSITTQTYFSMSSGSPESASHTSLITEPFAPSHIRVSRSSSLSQAHSHIQSQNIIDIRRRDDVLFGELREDKLKSQTSESKSNRRFSMSILSNLVRSSSSSPTPNVRPRPRSAYALTSIRSQDGDSAIGGQSLQATQYVDRLMPDVPIVQIGQSNTLRTGSLDHLGVLPLRLSDVAAADGNAGRSTLVPALHQTSAQVKENKKKSRFSHFAISKLTTK